MRSEIDRAGRRELATYPDRFAQLADALTAEVDTVAGHRLDDLVVRAGLTHPPARPPEPRKSRCRRRSRGTVGWRTG